MRLACFSTFYLRALKDLQRLISTGKIAEFFARSFNLNRKPVRFLQVQNLENGIDISRSVLTPYALMLREPTPQERVVGRWIDSELTLARAIGEGTAGQNELTRECIELRGLVAELDAGARAQGARPTAGYVEPERLEELIRFNNSGLRVKVFTERPHGEKERYVETTIGQPATREEKQTLAVPQDLEQGDVKAAMSTPQISKPSPATTAQVKSNRQLEAEGARPGRAPSARARTARVGPAPGPKGVEARDKVETPRVATKTLGEVRSHTVFPFPHNGSSWIGTPRRNGSRSFKSLLTLKRLKGPAVLASNRWLNSLSGLRLCGC